MHITIDVCGYLLVNNRYGQSFLEILSNTKLAKIFPGHYYDVNKGKCVGMLKFLIKKMLIL